MDGWTDREMDGWEKPSVSCLWISCHMGSMQQPQEDSSTATICILSSSAPVDSWKVGHMRTKSSLWPSYWAVPGSEPKINPSALQLLNRYIQSIFNQTLEAQIVHSSRNASSYYGFISEENERRKICFIVKVKATLSQMYLNHLVLNRIFNYKYTKFGSRID